MKSKSRKSILELLSLNSISQLINYLFIPILAKAFEPESFGNFYYIISIATILTVFFTFRLDQGIINSKNIFQAKTTLEANIFLSILTFLTLSIFSLIFFKEFFLAVLISFSLSSINLYTLYLNKKEIFKKPAILNLINIILVILVQLALSNIRNGLEIGYSIGIIITILFMFFDLYLNHEVRLDIKKITLYKSELIKHKNYLNFSFLASLFNLINTNILNIFVASQFGFFNAGIFGMSNKIMQAPLNLFGSAIYRVQVFKFSTKYIKGEYFKKELNFFVRKLIFIGILCFTITLILAKMEIFKVFLDSKWSSIDQILIILSFTCIFFFVTKSTPNFGIFNKHIYGLVLHSLSLAGLFILIMQIKRLEINFIDFILYYSVYKIVCQIIHLILLKLSVKNIDH
jgi:O-antigen/teichoic acid export membrane protein